MGCCRYARLIPYRAERLGVEGPASSARHRAAPPRGRARAPSCQCSFQARHLVVDARRPRGRVGGVRMAPPSERSAAGTSPSCEGLGPTPGTSPTKMPTNFFFAGIAHLSHRPGPGRHHHSAKIPGPIRGDRFEKPRSRPIAVKNPAVPGQFSLTRLGSIADSNRSLTQSTFGFASANRSGKASEANSVL
jgi:hypothetical protein